MGFFKLPRFARKYFRRNMHPMAEKEAWSAKTKLSILYAIISWHALGFVAYQIYNGNKHWPITHGIRHPDEDLARPAVQWATALGMNDVKVIRVKSFTKISQVENIKIERPENTDEQSNQNAAEGLAA